MSLVLSVRLRRNVSFVFSVIFSIAVSATAAELTYLYEGTVTTVPSELAGAFDVGDRISGSYTFEDSSTSSNAANGEVTYTFSVTAFPMNIDGYSLSNPSNGDVSIGDNVAGKDSYTVVSLSGGGTPIGGLAPVMHALQLADSTGSALSSTAISTLVNPADFDNPLITIDFGDGVNHARLEGQLNSVNAVPEPSGVGLALFGLLLPLRKRKR